MTITQTVKIPDSRCANEVGGTIDVPREVPTGPVVLTFTPEKKRKLTAEEEREFFKTHAEELNKEAEDWLEFISEVNLEALRRKRQEYGS